ncbi:DUF86 domain-containing protein [Candidatus Bipolaricaulota bacterium]|nr:DUF86 domain-containing protein [Candidatus Bipolaricaulota bacterium]
MRKVDRIRLQHMLDAARQAISFAQGKSREDLDRDRLLVFGLVKAIEIVGEAAYQMSETTRAELPKIPWDDVIGMRHRLVHAYFDINLDILWRTIQDDLPPLISALESALGKEKPEL